MRKTLKWMVLGLLALVIMAAVGGYLMVRSAGHPKIDGDLKLTGLSAGFVTAQDRLLQMELFRATWRGELAATFGPDALPSDIRMRVLGMRRNGDRHALKLDAPSRAYLQSYADGVNAYVKDHPGDHPIELKAAGLKPSAWSVADLVTLVHFIHYTHSTNFKAEIVGQKLIDKLGLAQAREIMPLTVNPDWGARPAPAGATAKAGRDGLRLGVDWAHLSVAPDSARTTGRSVRRARRRARPWSSTTRTWTAASCRATGTRWACSRPRSRPSGRRCPACPASWWAAPSTSPSA